MWHIDNILDWISLKR